MKISIIIAIMNMMPMSSPAFGVVLVFLDNEVNSSGIELFKLTLLEMDSIWDDAKKEFP